MPVKIRLSRQGRKKKPFYHIVITDSRAPRDGKFIERVGSYDPNTNPATIELNFDSALNWLQKGAQPSDTCRDILSYRGVMYKNHLLNGVRKGAFSEEEAEKRFQSWMKEKEDKIQTKKDGLSKAAADETKKRLEAESKVKEKRAEEIALRNSELAEEAVKAASEKASEGKEAVAETEGDVAKKVEEVKAEEAVPAETKAQEKVEEVKAEEAVPAEAKTEEKVEEVKTSTDEKAEEKKAAPVEAVQEKKVKAEKKEIPVEEVKEEPKKEEAKEPEAGNEEKAK